MLYCVACRVVLYRVVLCTIEAQHNNTVQIKGEKENNTEPNNITQHGIKQHNKTQDKITKQHCVVLCSVVVLRSFVLLCCVDLRCVVVLCCLHCVVVQPRTQGLFPTHRFDYLMGVPYARHCVVLC